MAIQLSRESQKPTTPALIQPPQGTKRVVIPPVEQRVAPLSLADRVQVGGSPLLSRVTDPTERAALLSVMGSVSEEDQGAVIPLFQSCLTEEICLQGSSSVLRAILAIHPSEREAVIGFVRRLIVDGTSGSAFYLMIQSMAAVPPSERESVADATYQLVTGSRYDSGCNSQRALLISAMAGLPTALERDVLVKAIKRLTQDAASCVDYAELVRGLAYIPDSAREGMVDYTRRLMAGSGSGSYLEVLARLGEIPYPRRSDAVALAEALFIPSTPWKDRMDLLNDLQVVRGGALFLVKEMITWINPPPHERVDLYFRLSPLSGTQLRALDYVLRVREIGFFTVRMENPAHRMKAVCPLIAFFLRNPSDDDVSAFLQFLHALIDAGESSAFDGGSKVLVIAAASRVSPDQRPRFIAFLTSLLTADMIPAEKAELIAFLGSTPEADWETTAMQVRRLISPDMVSEERIQMIEFVRSLNPGGLRRVLEWVDLPDWTREHTRNLAMHAVLGGAEQIHRALAHEPPLISPDVIMAFITAKASVDTHEKRRELHASRVLDLLRGVQAEREVDMPANIAAAIEWLRTVTHPGQEQALRALIGPRGEADPFGPLLIGPPAYMGDDGFTIRGARLSGPEVIARLWLFITDLHPTERELAQLSFLAALADSYTDGVLVCNIRKVLQLFSGVLGGRLPGVDFHIAFLPRSVDDFFRLFWEGSTEGVRHQHIHDPDKLRGAARHFLSIQDPPVGEGGLLYSQFMADLEKVIELNLDQDPPSRDSAS